MNQHAEPQHDPDDMFADTRMSMGDHIEELRRHLLRAFYGFALGLFASFFIGHWVMTTVICKPVEDQLLYYWQNYNKNQLEPLTDKITKYGTLKLPEYPLDLYELASRLELRDEAGKKIGKLTPVGGPIFTPAVGFEALWNENLWRLRGSDVDRSKEARDRWIYLKPRARDFVKSMQEFSIEAKPPTLSSMAPQETFLVFLKVCMLTGLIISCPWVFYQIWTFIAAGLYPQEKRLVNVYMPYSIGLFLIGAFVCQFMVIPKAIAGLLWFNDWLGVQPDFRLNEWLSFAILMPLIFGLSFQLPLVMLFVYTIGAIDIQGFRKFRGIAYFIIASLAAIFLPTPDILSMMMLTVPMIFLYELGIFLCWMRPRMEYEDSDPDLQDLIEV